MWGPQLSLVAVLASASPEETPLGHALLPPPPPSPAAWGPLPCLRAEHPQAARGWGWGPLGAQAALRSLCAQPSFLLSGLLGTTCLEGFTVGYFLWHLGQGPGG